MTILLIFTILILISISMWQISKMFELSQTNVNTTEIADDKDNDYQGKLMFAFLVFIYLLTLFRFINGVMFCYLKQLQIMEICMTHSCGQHSL